MRTDRDGTDAPDAGATAGALDDAPKPMSLLPCPFCGGVPGISTAGPGCFWVDCGTCHVSGSDGTQDYARRVWNTRAYLAELTALRAENERLREALEAYLFAEEIDDEALRQAELAVARQRARTALNGGS